MNSIAFIEENVTIYLPFRYSNREEKKKKKEDKCVVYVAIRDRTFDQIINLVPSCFDLDASY